MFDIPRASTGALDGRARPPGHLAPRALPSLLGAALALPLLVAPVVAQTDFYNTDAGRPLQIEDAAPVERRAFEIQAAPLRVERAHGGTYSWGIEPELAYGIFPRAHVEVGLPLAFVDAGLGSPTAGLAGVDVSVLYSLNAETAIPALAIAGSVLVPAGHLAPDGTYGSVKGILTRTLPWARFHVNGQYTFGASLPASTDGVAPGATPIGGQALELSRWLAGVAVDRPFPLRSMLLTGEVYAREPLRAGEELEWNAGIGTRYQLSPRVALDAGTGRRLTGDDRGWYATVGAAVAVGLPWRL